MTAAADDRSLRTARRARVFAGMAGAGIDVLVLGRRDDVAYATGARSLWTAGTRPFGAAAVLVSDREAVHLLSTWDAGVPDDVPFEHLYGLTWNPATMLAALAAIPGLVAAGRIGVDALSPGFARAVRRLAPEAEVVPADDVVRAARAAKLPGEVERIRAAVAVAADGAGAAVAAVAAGASTVEGVAAAVEAMAHRGSTVPASAPQVRRVGDAVHADLGVLVDGYEGGAGRTATAGGDDVVPPAHRSLVAACRAGATGIDLRAAAGATRWMVRGCGMGFEPPVVTDRLGAGERLAAGMVLSVEVDDGAAARRDVVLVTDGDPLVF